MPSPTLLVVDDEPLLGASVRRLLRHDFDVTVVLRGREAVDLVAGGARYDAILCDLNLPDLDGLAVHAAIAVIEPAQAERIVFCSGGLRADVESKLRALPNEQLDKPFELAELRLVLEQVARRAVATR